MEPTTVTTIVLVLLALIALAMAVYAWISPWQPARALTPEEQAEAAIDAEVRQMRRAIELWERQQYRP